MSWLFALMLSFGVAQAQVPSPYVRSVDLLHKLYMYPEATDHPASASPLAIFEASARRLERQIDWLFVDVVDGRATLRHGDGNQLGTVVVFGWDDLAAGLYALETTTLSAGYHLGDDVDLRLQALVGMTDVLDRYTRVLAGERLDAFDTRLKGTLMGIGASLGNREDQLTILSVMPDGPAARGGLLDDDRIVRIDDASTVNMPVQEAVRRIRGERGSEVVLLIERTDPVTSESQTVSLPLVRDRVIIENVHHDVLEDDIGMIRIDNISQRTVFNLRRALQDLSDRGGLKHGLVLDLRGNTGGSMKDSAGVVDAFVTEGNLITTRGPDGAPVPGLTPSIDARASGDEPQLPIVVLVDRRTASGAEIISGALKGLGRAVLIGERTYGKGEVQKIYTLETGMRFKITVAEYQVAGGIEVARHGVLADRVVHRVVLDELGARFVGWDPERDDVPWDAIVPMVDERTAWRDIEEPEWIDVPMEAARRAVRDAAGNSREQIFAALDPILAELRVAQEAHLSEALTAKGLDWTSATGPGATPEAEVTLTVLHDVDDPNVHIVRATVHNHGPTPLRRTLVRLTSEDFSAWDDLLLPIGEVPSGVEVVGEARVRMRPGVDPRRDRVEVSLLADQRPSLQLPQQHLDAVGTPRPRLRAEARLVPDGDNYAAHVRLSNLSRNDLAGVEVYFAYPEDIDVELLDHAHRLPTFGAGDNVDLVLNMKLGPDAPPTLPLRLVVKGDDVGTFAKWDMDLRLTGEVDDRQAPRIEARRAPLSAPVGPLTLPLHLTDESGLDHVTVFVNGQKVLWQRSTRPRLDVRPTVLLEQGTNTILVMVTDDEGERTQRTLRIFGEASDDVIVQGTEPPAAP